MDLDPAPDPAIFVLDLQDTNNKLFKKSLSAYYFLMRKSPKFGHFLNFNYFFRPEIIFFQTCFTVQKSCMPLSTSGLNHQT
jgi:hypothetical protein